MPSSSPSIDDARRYLEYRKGGPGPVTDELEATASPATGGAPRIAAGLWDLLGAVLAEIKATNGAAYDRGYEDGENSVEDPDDTYQDGYADGFAAAERKARAAFPTSTTPDLAPDPDALR